ncbi:protein tamozhennic [Drosophila tropicalis]|uniref:protein tamozhennic n=1 Tax=Drosophila tropicalis TaxID=46794 RepID=UPI0035ABC8F2
MSDFVPREILPDLWAEILRYHWSYLETEESIKKLEERKKLEGCLKEFLCVVPHDRKFFLPETEQVLRKTVRELPSFTAQNAIVGFEAISQYANNLFTKPWRKEFRVLRTYSGYYQHEVQSNLVDAEKLLLAMGYRKTAEDTFVLDGPICPDQVTNVSRDAMAAYVECQIMKTIYAGLTAAGFTCSWQDILHYRERHVGGTTQTIKEMAYRLSEKRRKPVENTYSNVGAAGPPSKGSTAACAVHGNPSCVYHPNNPPMNLKSKEAGKFLPPYPAPPTSQSSSTLMTHSRSLEHYQEPHAVLPHRHSFEQHQQCHHPHSHPHVYETPYDCLDGLSLSSSASYAAVAGAYNAPGNRYPLPYNISSHLQNAQYGPPSDGYGTMEQNMYATIEKPGSGSAASQTPMHSCGYHQSAPPAATAAALAAMQHRQSTYPPDHHLIDFDERAQLTQHDFGAHEYDPRMYQAAAPRGSGQIRSKMNAMYAQPRDLMAYAGYDLPTTIPQPQTSRSTAAQDTYVYARPMPKSSRMRSLAEAGGSNPTDKHKHAELMPQDPMDNNRKLHKELKERQSGTATADSRHRRVPVDEQDIPTTVLDMSGYESASLDGFTTLGSTSPPLMPKVQEGVGSFESWNYVFKNLERSGYSKDLGDREDLLMQSLDLDSLTLNNGVASPGDKRRDVSTAKPSTTRATAGPHTNPDKAKSASSTHQSRREPSCVVQAAAPTPAPNSSSAGLKKMKSALKTATIDNRATGSRNKTGAIAKHPPPVSTQLIVTSPNEWSCRFCTFLNPNTKRICEMCCRSKDFNLEAASTAAATASASNVSHASSTCV